MTTKKALMESQRIGQDYNTNAHYNSIVIVITIVINIVVKMNLRKLK